MARRRSHRRTRRTRYRLFDHLMIAGIVGGAVYLMLHSILTVGPGPSMVLGVLAAGISLGSMVRLPRWRSPIVWRHRR